MASLQFVTRNKFYHETDAASGSPGINSDPWHQNQITQIEDGISVPAEVLKEDLAVNFMISDCNGGGSRFTVHGSGYAHRIF